MKTVKIEINLFRFKELNEAAQRCALWVTKNDLNNVEGFDGQQWTEESAREHIEINEYYFYSSGAAAHTLHYTGNQPKSGKTFLIFHNKEHEIK